MLKFVLIITIVGSWTSPGPALYEKFVYRDLTYKECLDKGHRIADSILLSHETNVNYIEFQCHKVPEND